MKKILENLKKRAKNPYFWVGIVGTILSAARIDATSLTNWNILFNNVVGILSNPYLLGTVVMSLLGVFVNPTTKGLKDGNE